jgi:hypothetical protein
MMINKKGNMGNIARLLAHPTMCTQDLLRNVIYFIQEVHCSPDPWTNEVQLTQQRDKFIGSFMSPID